MRQLKGIAKEMKSRWLLGVVRMKKQEEWGGAFHIAALRSVGFLLLLEVSSGQGFVFGSL